MGFYLVNGFDSLGDNVVDYLVLVLDFHGEGALEELLGSVVDVHLEVDLLVGKELKFSKIWVLC